MFPTSRRALQCFTVFAAAAAALAGCSRSQPDAPSTSDLLYVWAFDSDEESSDFLAVIEADP